MTRAVVSSMVLEYGPAHERLRIWTRGGLAGNLCFGRHDGEQLAEALASDFGLEEDDDAEEGTRRWVAT